MKRVVRPMKGIAALALLVALVGGIPWALWYFIGWPLPHHVPSAVQVGRALDRQGIPTQALIDALAVVVWLSWAALIACLAVEVPAAWAGRHPARLPLAGAFQPVVGRLVAAVIVACLALAPRPVQSATPARSGGLTAGTDGRPVAALVLDKATLTAASFARGPIASAPPATAAAPAAPVAPQAGTTDTTYVVQPGDTLWGIAERQLGDPLRWSEIFQLNEGRPQPGGVTLIDPHWIDPGWTLLLPAATAPPPAAPTPVVEATVITPSNPVPSPSTSPTTTVPTTTVPTETPPSSAASPAKSTRTDTPAPADSENVPVRLPSGSVVAGSFAAGVLSTVALGRLRRRHAYRYRPPGPGRRPAPGPPRPVLRHLAAGAAANGRRPPNLDEVPAVTDDDPDHRERPDLIDLGDRDGTPVAAALSDLAGVTLSGIGTDDVLRAWLTALVVRAGPIAAEVLIALPALDRLVPGLASVPPGVRVVDDTGRVLRVLEAEVLARTRQLDADDAPDVVTWRRAHPWEPVPTIIAVVDTIATHDAARWEAIMSVGGRLGLGVVVLDPDTPTPVRLALGPNDTVCSASDRLAHLVGARLFTLNAVEAGDLLAAVADAEQRPDSTTDRDLTEPGPSEGGSSDGTPEAWPEPIADEPGRQPAPITVRLLGPYEIDVGGQPITTGLRTSAKELLAWYLLRPDGAAIETAVDDLWPDTEPARVHKHFWIAASNLRTRLGAAAEPETKLLVQTGHVYRLDSDAITCDLWQFHAALALANRADRDATTRDLLRRAVACYRGDLAQGVDYDWIEPVRQDLHRRALDAHLRLAELEDRLGNPDAGTATLERAVDLDRYAEEPYRRLMALHARRDRPDAIAATWRLLQRHLAEIDVDPEPATVRLHRTLTTEAARAGHTRGTRFPS